MVVILINVSEVLESTLNETQMNRQYIKDPLARGSINKYLLSKYKQHQQLVPNTEGILDILSQVYSKVEKSKQEKAKSKVFKGTHIVLLAEGY